MKTIKFDTRGKGMVNLKPLSVLRIKYRRNFSILAIGIVLVLAFTACSNPSSTTDVKGNKSGSITFINLPSDFSISACFVNPNPNIQWTIANRGFGPNSLNPLDGDDWNSGCTGQGFDVQDNKIIINGCRYTKDESGLWHGSDGYDFSFSGYGSVWAGFTTGAENIIAFGFNNVQFTNGNATINFAASSLVLPQTAGKINLSNASAYNDKYVIAFGILPDASTVLYGFGDAVSSTSLKGFKVSGGVATIPVWKFTTSTAQFSSYTGADTPTILELVILDTETFDTLDFANNSAKYKYLQYSSIYSNSVTFSGGTADVDAGSGTKVPASGW